jgi:hypothetical protein
MQGQNVVMPAGAAQVRVPLVGLNDIEVPDLSEKSDGIAEVGDVQFDAAKPRHCYGHDDLPHLTPHGEIGSCDWTLTTNAGRSQAVGRENEGERRSATSGPHKLNFLLIRHRMNMRGCRPK